MGRTHRHDRHGIVAALAQRDDDNISPAAARFAVLRKFLLLTVVPLGRRA